MGLQDNRIVVGNWGHIVIQFIHTLCSYFGDGAGPFAHHNSIPVPFAGICHSIPV